MAKGLDERNYCDNEKIFEKDVDGVATKNKGIPDCSSNFNKDYIHDQLLKC